ncbi:MAG: hypothetical protein ABSD88_20900, partial [Candidatus Korobacteraceae bacterium]
MQVDAGSHLSADGQGYVGNPCGGGLPGAGPGGGPYDCNNNGDGGSYGGKGGGAKTNLMITYGSDWTPTDLGSGGSGGWGVPNGPTGGNGGGAIRLIISGTLTDNGVISANGDPGPVTSSGAGGGSGGSIYVTTGTLAGSGTFTANGGSSASSFGGGGGRVAVYYTNASGYTGFDTSAATGGAGGTNGTVLFADLTHSPTDDLYVYEQFTIAPSTVATYNSITVDNGGTLTIGGGANITVSSNLILTGNSTLLLQSSNNSAQVGGAWQGAGVTISVANLQVDAGSHISADGQGYVGSVCYNPGVGPGGGPLNCNNNGNGGSYGGKGGGADTNSMITYGSAWAPTDLGSGGSGGWGIPGPTGGNGGGAIRLIISGTLTDNGVISANGDPGPVTSSGAGGGSGGSIYVTTGTLAGSGTFTANGGSSASSFGGGGGRVAVYYSTLSGFNPNLSTADPGSAGQAGSVVFVKNPDNNLLVPSGRLVIKQDESVSFKNVTVQNGSTVIMSGGSTLTSGGTLTVTGASTVLVQAKNTAPVGGLWVGVGAGISAINVQIDAGSIISADGQGYPGSGCSGPGSGPGGGPLYCNNQGNGGSYGGIGGGPNPAPTYGSILAPTDLGSGGSGAYGGLTGGTGGGAIQLVVLQTLTNNGTVTANGNGAPGNAGGGSGGSVYVVTGTLAGTGAFTANGGATGAPTGGGGGRIAICYSSGGFGGGSVSANGGTGAANGTATYCLPAVVTTNPAGLNFTVDGTSYSSAQTFYWSNSSSHTIATSSPQGAGGTRNVFSSWSDSGAISHSVTATAGGGAATYTANFTTQYLLTTAVAPSGSGTVGALPSSG